MKGIILAAGIGKRMGDLTKDSPKPMLKVGDSPIIEYSINLFKRFGIDDIIINLHHKPSVITDYIGDGKRLGVKISYSYEKVLLGTAGAVKKVEPLLKETFLVAYGDTLRDIDIRGMLRYHKEKKADMTIAVYPVGDSRDFGVAKMRQDGSICEFIEKHGKIKDRKTAYANCGVYVIEPRVLSKIPKNRSYDFASNLFPRLIKEGCRLYGYHTKSYLLDIGTPESYAKARKVFHMFKDL